MNRKATQRGVVSKQALIGVIVGGIFLTVIVVFMGRADEGAINVSEVINESNVAARESIQRGETPAAAIISPTQNSKPSAPNGGLVPSGVPVEAPEPEPVVEGASTTAETASSTEAEDAPESAEILENGDGEEAVN